MDHLEEMNGEEENMRTTEELDGPCGEQKKGRTKPHLYSNEEDLAILREVLVEKPFGKKCSKEWKAIHDRCNIAVKDGIAIKRRFQLLMDQFKKDDVKSLKGSGLEEEYDEKRKLLQEISDIMNDTKVLCETTDEAKRKNADDEASQAQNIRKASMESLKPDVESPEVNEYEIKKKRLRKDEYLTLLEKSDEREHESRTLTLKLDERRLEIQEREIAIKEQNEAHRREQERRQLALEEKRMEMEARKADSDQKERQLFLQLLSSQLNRSDADK